MTFAITGTVLAINSISNWEGMSNALTNAASNGMEKLAIGNLRDTNIAISMANITSTQLFWFGIIIISVILLCFAGSFASLFFGYKIDEELEKQIVKELEEIHEKDALEAQAKESRMTAEEGI